MQNVKHLLNNVSFISKKYDDIAKITGENFNVFSVMSMESNERYTHSAIIGELLNPKGSHSQGSVFLKLFFDEIITLNEIENFDFENAKVILEEHIGLIDEEYSKGGFIDIVIKDNSNVIVIENKIYAGDQTNQLLRYKRYYPNCVLFYLNLFGSEPSKGSSVNLILGKDFFIMSYQNEITNWLEKCHKEAVEQPILRETIKQYLNLVKKLTNQTINDNMSEELIKVIQKDFKSSQEIFNNFQKAKNKILSKIRERIKSLILIDFENKYYIIDSIKSDVGLKNSHLWLNSIKNKDNGIQLYFGIEPFSGNGGIQNNLFVGILDIYGQRENFFKEEIDEIKINGWWRETENFEIFKNFTIDFSNIDFLQFLVDYPQEQEELAKFIVEKTKCYIDRKEQIFMRIHKIAENNSNSSVIK